MPTMTVQQITNLSVTARTQRRTPSGVLLNGTEAFKNPNPLGLDGLPVPMTKEPPIHLPTNTLDEHLMNTIRWLGMWEHLVKKAATKFSSYSLELTAPSAASFVRLQNLVLLSNYGQGWQNFTKQLFYDWALCTNGYFVEIIRATNSPSAQAVGLARINPLKCKRTGNHMFPVIFTNDRGIEVPLGFWQVFMSDDNRGAPHSSSICAALSCWKTIYELAAIQERICAVEAAEQFTAMVFIGGMTHKIIDEGKEDAEEQIEEMGGTFTRGKLIIPNRTGNPVNVDEVTVIDRPPVEHVEQERLNGILEFCHALGLDPAEGHPDLVRSTPLDGGRAANLAQEQIEASGIADVVKQLSLSINRPDVSGRANFRMFVDTVSGRQAQANLRGTQIDNEIKLLGAGISEEAVQGILAEKDLIPADVVQGDSDVTDEVIGDGEKLEDENE